MKFGCIKHYFVARDTKSEICTNIVLEVHRFAHAHQIGSITIFTFSLNFDLDCKQSLYKLYLDFIESL